MSPVPLIELQRRLAEAGRIRMGERTEKGAPKRLTTWRITSPSEELIKQAAGLYGGEPKPWESPTGPQFEVVTTSAELPVLVMPGYSLRQGYELRTSPTLVERRCDGSEMDDGRPCLCNAEGEDRCHLLTRLTVALPELTTMLGWRLETKGDNAARTLLASMDLVHGVAGGRPFVPARLRIVEKRGSKDGQAIRWVEPVIDVSIRYSELGLGEKPAQAALPYTPIEAAPGNGTSLSDGLAIAEAQTSTRTARSAAPLPAPDEEIPFGEAPVPVPDGPSETGNTIAASTRDKPLTKAQATKLNVLIGTLRDEQEAITTKQLYSALAKSRAIDVETMIGVLEGAADEEGALHWGPLRDSLTRAEASDLIDRLERMEASVPA